MNVTVKSATLPPSSRLNNVPPPSRLPPTTKVDIEPPATLQGRFASACRLIQQTKRKVGRNLNKFGNSFKFKKSVETPVSSNKEESSDGTNSKFKKLVRKNAIKKNNLNAPKLFNLTTSLNNNGIESNSVKTHSNQQIKMTHSTTRQRTNVKACLVNTDFQFQQKKNELFELDKFRSLNEKEPSLKEPANPIKFENFFQCIEIENINRNVIVKSTSFSDKSGVRKDVPIKSRSFRTLAEFNNSNNNNIFHYGNSNTYDEFRMKLRHFENSQTNLNDLKDSNKGFNLTYNSIPVKCNLLAPPPVNLLVNRQESLESWNKFIHQLDDILMNNAGELV